MGGCPNDPAKVMDNLKYMIETLNKTFSCPPTCPAKCQEAPPVMAPPQPEFQTSVKQKRSVRQEYQVKENLLIETQPKESQSRKSRLFKFGHPRIYKLEKCRGLSNVKCCLQRIFETELRGSHLVPCLCKRNYGLQDTCQRTGCHGTQACLSCPPCCGPSYFNRTYVGKPIPKTRYYQIVRKRIEDNGRYVKLIRVCSDSCCEKSCDNAKSKVHTACTQTMTVSCPYCNDFCKNYDETKRTSSKGTSPENEVLNCSIDSDPKSQISKLEQSVQPDFKTFFISKENFSNKQSKFVQIEEDSSEYDDSTSSFISNPKSDRAKVEVSVQSDIEMHFMSNFQLHFMSKKFGKKKAKETLNMLCDKSIQTDSSKYEDSISSFISKTKTHKSNVDISEESPLKTYFISEKFRNNSTFNNHIQLSHVTQSTSTTDCNETCGSLTKLDDSIPGKDKLKTSSIELVKKENVIFETTPSSSATISLTTQDNSKHLASIPSILCKNNSCKLKKKVRFRSCPALCNEDP